MKYLESCFEVHNEDRWYKVSFDLLDCDVTGKTAVRKYRMSTFLKEISFKINLKKEVLYRIV